MSDTAVAILGVVVGFITAFFAEPVKNYFAERRRLEYIRLSLYKEIIGNFFSLMSLPKDFLAEYLVVDKHLLISVTNKYYNYVIENRIEDYYRLDDTMMIDVLYKYINLMLLPDDELDKMGLFSYSEYKELYNQTVITYLKKGMFNKKLLSKIVSASAIKYMESLETKRETPPTTPEQKRTGNSGEVHQKDNPKGVGS